MSFKNRVQGLIDFYFQTNGVMAHHTDAYHNEADELDINPHVSDKERLASRRIGINETKTTIKDDNCKYICCVQYKGLWEQES